MSASLELPSNFIWKSLVQLGGSPHGSSVYERMRTECPQEESQESAGFARRRDATRRVISWRNAHDSQISARLAGFSVTQYQCLDTRERKACTSFSSARANSLPSRSSPFTDQCDQSSVPRTFLYVTLRPSKRIVVVVVVFSDLSSIELIQYTKLLRSRCIIRCTKHRRGHRSSAIHAIAINESGMETGTIHFR